MLDDRPYMRRAPEAFGGVRWSATVLLLIATGIAFIIQSMLQRDYAIAVSSYPEVRKVDVVATYLALSPAGILNGYLWQFFTFQFLHQGLPHIVLNLIGIYFFGRELEEALGKASFLKLYFGSGAAGGVLHILFAFALPKYFGASVVGASAGGCGLMAAYCALYWNRQIHLNLMFIPMTMTGRNLLWVIAGTSFILGMLPGQRVAHAAHAGGMLAGLYYVFGIMQGSRWATWPTFRRAARRPRELVRTVSARQAEWQAHPRPATEEDLGPAEFISKEVDPILDKISAHGIHSLTPEERKILEKARAKMAKRQA